MGGEIGEGGGVDIEGEGKVAAAGMEGVENVEKLVLRARPRGQELQVVEE